MIIRKNTATGLGGGLLPAVGTSSMNGWLPRFDAAATQRAKSRRPPIPESHSAADNEQQRPPPLRCRPIIDDDIPTVAALLHNGFRTSPARRFSQAMHEIAARRTPEGFPRLGYVLESGSRPVGALLAITSHIDDGWSPETRCNVSCWYVEPEFRIYAPLLLAPFARLKGATLVNISPHEATLRTIETQGFSRFSSGLFAGVPLLAPARASVTAVRFRPGDSHAGRLTAGEQSILRDHAESGCISLVCDTGGESHPFVFRRRFHRRLLLPFAQLVYCRDVAGLERCAHAIGVFLARRFLSFVVIATDLKPGSMPGRHFAGRRAMYYKGPQPPRTGDLAYTELALFGL